MFKRREKCVSYEWVLKKKHCGGLFGGMFGHKKSSDCGTCGGGGYDTGCSTCGDVVYPSGQWPSSQGYDVYGAGQMAPTSYGAGQMAPTTYGAGQMNSGYGAGQMGTGGGMMAPPLGWRFGPERPGDARRGHPHDRGPAGPQPAACCSSPRPATDRPGDRRDRPIDVPACPPGNAGTFACASEVRCHVDSPGSEHRRPRLTPPAVCG